MYDEGGKMLESSLKLASNYELILRLAFKRQRLEDFADLLRFE